jgi:hypothetical protein
VTRNGTWLLAVLLLAMPAAGDDALLLQWDAPMRETFSLKRMPGSEASLEVRKRFGYNFDCPQTDALVALHVKDATFFETLDRLAAGLDLYLVGVPVVGEKKGFLEEGPLALVPADGPMGPAMVTYLGPSRLSVESVSVVSVRRCAPRAKPSLGLPDNIPLPDDLVRTIRHFGPGADDAPRLTLHLKWIVEPGFRDVTIVAFSLNQAVDDHGHMLQKDGDVHVPVVANSTFAIDFEAPAARTKMIKKLQGILRFAIPVDRGEVTFLPSETKTAKTLGSASITVDEIDGGKVSVTVIGTPSGIRPEHGLSSIWLEGEGDHFPGEPSFLTLAAFDGKGAAIGGHESYGSDEGGKITYKLELDRAPEKLMFKAITKVAARELPVAFANIPLPE